MQLRRPPSKDRRPFHKLVRRRDRDRNDADDGAFELVLSARDFTERTRAAIDDKMSLSATLLRAGEVEEASRLVSELERDVRESQAALVEKMNERRAAGAARRKPPVRTRPAKVLAVALVGALLSGLSAVGASVVRDFQSGGAERRAGQRAEAGGEARSEDGGDGARSVTGSRYVRLGGVRVLMTPAQLSAYRKLISGKADEKTLESFLEGLLEQVADKDVPAVLKAVTERVEKARDEVKKDVEPAAPARPERDVGAGANRPEAQADCRAAARWAERSCRRDERQRRAARMRSAWFERSAPERPEPAPAPAQPPERSAPETTSPSSGGGVLRSPSL